MKRPPIEPRPFPILLSYAYLMGVSEERMDTILSTPNVDFLIDSGAFSAKNMGIEISLDGYMQWLKRWEHKLFGYVALDVVQDPVGTDRNLQIMLENGLKPFPVHVFGDDKERMDQLFEWSPRLVFLAGLRRPHRGAAPESYVKQKMEWAGDRPVHWLGYVRVPMLRAFLPYSCDCSSWKSPMRWGHLRVYFGNGEWRSYARKQRDRMDVDSALSSILEECGFTVDDWYDDKLWARNIRAGIPDTRFLTMQVTARSWMKFVLDFQCLFGPRIFLANQVSYDFTALCRHVNSIDIMEYQRNRIEGKR